MRSPFFVQNPGSNLYCGNFGTTVAVWRQVGTRPSTFVYCKTVKRTLSWPLGG